MLSKLAIKNFAIIEDIEVSFKDGLTVLTGETGAGKSLIIDSISLLLGSRASSEMIRNGEDKATITGVFNFSNPRLESLLISSGVTFINNELTITRVITKDKSTVKINNKVISLNELKEISKYLADIHEQFDMTKLLNKDNYLEILDGYKYELIKEYKDNYTISKNELLEAHEEYLELKNKVEMINKKREEYEFYLKELKAFNLSINEEEDIDSRISLLKNFDKIYSLLEESKSLIDKDSLSDIYEIKENINRLAEYQNEYSDIYSRLNDYYYEIEAIYDELKHKLSRMDYDPKELEELENRKSDINILKKKYGMSIAELIDYQKELETLLSSKEDLDYVLKEKKENEVEKYEKAYKSAMDLHKIRLSVAKNIEKDIAKNLVELALKSRFEIVVNNKEKNEEVDLSIFLDDGIDEVDFLIETNIGEGLKPITKIISGGEMSRIMLALKILFIKSQKISTAIFDEIDTGISGEIAHKVAQKIKEVSLSTQVISITHLPQVASLSNHHIKISKSVINGRTFTAIKELSLDEKIYEIASMISGGKVTNSQLEYAKEMILNND